jgi:hypothetical protein
MHAKTPRGAKAWLELAKKTPLPILKASAKLLTGQIKGGASLADMAQTIERDPALCLHLFLAANRLNQNKDVEILSLSHVITLLGMQGVVNVVKQAPQIQLRNSDAYQKGYLQAQADSSLAGQLAQYWSAQMHVGNPEKLKWATIISGAPQWLMWRIGYESMRKSQFLIHHDFHPIEKVEKSVFGCHLDDVERVVGRQLKLPLLAQQVLERAERPSPQEWAKMLSPKYLDYFDNNTALKLQKSKPVTLITLVRYLSAQVNFGWMRRHCLRSQTILAHLANQPLDLVIKQNHQFVVEHSRSHCAVQVMPAAASLIWPYQHEITRPWLRKPVPCMMSEMERETSSVKFNGMADISNSDVSNINPSSIKQPPRHANKNVLVDLITQFNKQSEKFKDVHEILLTCNKAINEGLGMRRTFVCVLDKSGAVLKPLYYVGVEKYSSIRDLKIKLQDNRFFAKLLGRSSSLKIDQTNFSQAKNMIEPGVLKTLGNKNFMAMSLFANGKAIGVVYADASEGEDDISEKEYQAFKKICQSAGNALDSYVQKRKAG